MWMFFSAVQRLCESYFTEQRRGSRRFTESFLDTNYMGFFGHVRFENAVPNALKVKNQLPKVREN